MNKKAQTATPTTILIVAEIAMVAIVVFGLFSIVSAIKEKGVFERKYFSRDIALILDEIFSAQGNLFYSYNPIKASIKRHDFDFTGKIVKVDGEAYPYAEGGQKASLGKLEKPGWLIFSKYGDNVAASASADFEFNKHELSCPEGKPRITSVLLDPGHGWDSKEEFGDSGFELKEKDTVNLRESNLNSKLAFSIASELQSRLSAKWTREVKGEHLTQDPVSEQKLELKERIKLVKETNADLILSIHVGNDTANEQYVKVFVNDKNANAIAVGCRLVNEISSTFDLLLTGSALIPVNAKMQGSDYHKTKELLNTDKTVIVLEIGNINADAGRSIVINKRKELALAIARALTQ